MSEQAKPTPLSRATAGPSIRLPRATAFLAAGLAFLALVLGPLPGALATDMLVVAPNSAVNADGQCSLAEAIQNANDDAQTNADCPAGAAADTITLAVPVVVDGATLFPSPGTPGYIDFGSSGLPDVTTEMTITGNSITRTGAADYRFLVIRATGSLTLDNVTLSNGRVAGHCALFGISDHTGCGGALVNQGGALALVSAALNNNEAVEIVASDIAWGGAIAMFGGTLSATDSSFTGNAAEYGGAIAAAFATMSVIDSQFVTNTAVASGGAIHNGTLGELTVAGSLFSGNAVTNAPFAFLGGGAINNAGSSSNLFVINSAFDGNSADYGGALVNFNASDATVVNSTLTNNDALQGGAILNRGSGATLNLFASVVSGNEAGFSSGGGISNGGSSDSGIAFIENSQITGNTSTNDGGGIATNGQLTVENSAVDGNEASADGGGIFVGSLTNQDVHILGSSVSGNFAGFSGGGLYYTENPSGSFTNNLVVENSVFDDNEADEGGGIYAEYTDVTISGSTLSNNNATNVGLGGGGGIHMRSFIVGGAHLAMTNSTVSGNTASQDGGGVYINGSAVTADLRSMTIANNSANSANGADGLHSLASIAAVTVADTVVSANGNRNCLDAAFFGVTDGGNNISSDGTCDFADTGGGVGDNVDPLLDALAENGGNTQTHALQAGSPAIDNGSVGCPAADQRGAARTSSCDIGAYEAPAGTASLSISVDTTTIYELGETTATVEVILDNSGPDARPVEVVVPLQVTGSASGVGYDYTLSNQVALGAADAGRVVALMFTVAAGDTDTQSFTVTAVDDPYVEGDETVDIVAGVLGNASFSSGDSVSVTIVSDDAPPPLPVLIDIRPGSDINPINLKSRGVIPVAILSSAGFDATDVDPFTVTLAGAGVRVRPNGTAQASVKDVNHDGLPDLLVHVMTEDLNLTSLDVVAVLEGQTYGGQAIIGSDVVKIVP